MILRRKFGLYVLAGLVAVGLVIGLYFAVTYKETVENTASSSTDIASNNNTDNTNGKHSKTAKLRCANNNFPKYTSGVVTNGIECAKIGSWILQKGGSAADAAIAALFCEGIAQPQSMGLGGGFLLTIYTKETGKIETLDAREVAPLAATSDMYHGNQTLAREGALAVAVPGELKGYWELYQRYGKLSWRDLIQPSIDLCRKGNVVTSYLASMLKSYRNAILNEPTLREIFIDPLTNEPWLEGQKIKRLKLAETLEIIALEGVDALYSSNGTLTKSFVQDIAERGGIITEEDLSVYKPRWNDPIVTQLENDYKLYSSPLPGSGVILSFIMNILKGYLDTNDTWTIHNWQRIIESFKFGYGRRTELGDISGLDELITNLTSETYALGIRENIFDNRTFQDPKYYGANYSNVEDHGTAHINILAPNGDAVSVTSTINLILGAKFRSKSTGIILNDEMDDFAIPKIKNSFDLPPSPANFIEPGKRPFSSMCPTIILDQEGDVRLIVGAAGGSKITTSTALVSMRNLIFGRSLKDSITDKRMHHQLFPMAIQYEDDIEQEFMDELKAIGHETMPVSTSSGFAAVTAISRQCGTVFGHYDIRRQGSVALF